MNHSAAVIHYKVYLCASGYEPEIRRMTIDKDISRNYFYLKQRLTSIFPTLKDTTFTISWKDCEGDTVRICTDEELVIALSEMQKFDLKKIFVSTTPQHGSEGPIHPNIKCNGCGHLVQGFRYKCVVCGDFDLCPDCERSQVHPDHPMIRIPLPMSLDGPFCHRFFQKISKHMENLYQASERWEKKGRGDCGAREGGKRDKRSHRGCPVAGVSEPLNQLFNFLNSYSEKDETTPPATEEPQQGDQQANSNLRPEVFNDQKKLCDFLKQGLTSFLDPLGTGEYRQGGERGEPATKVGASGTEARKKSRQEVPESWQKQEVSAAQRVLRVQPSAQAQGPPTVQPPKQSLQSAPPAKQSTQAAQVAPPAKQTMQAAALPAKQPLPAATPSKQPVQAAAPSSKQPMQAAPSSKQPMSGPPPKQSGQAKLPVQGVPMDPVQAGLMKQLALANMAKQQIMAAAAAKQAAKAQAQQQIAQQQQQIAQQQQQVAQQQLAHLQAQQLIQLQAQSAQPTAPKVQQFNPVLPAAPRAQQPQPVEVQPTPQAVQPAQPALQSSEQQKPNQDVAQQVNPRREKEDSPVLDSTWAVIPNNYQVTDMTGGAKPANSELPNSDPTTSEASATSVETNNNAPPTAKSLYPAIPVMPITPSGQNIVDVTLDKLFSMGFVDHEGWLRLLVENKNGNIDEVLRFLTPIPKPSDK